MRVRLRLGSSASLLVVASDYEGQPLVVLEALALGRPVVATAVGRVPELVNPSVGRIVSPGDPRALGGALAEVAGNSELRRRMGAEASQDSLACTLEDVIDRYHELYSHGSISPL